MIIKTPEEFYLDTNKITAIRYGLHGFNASKEKIFCVRVWTQGIEEPFVVALFDEAEDARDYADKIARDWANFTSGKIYRV